MKRQQKVYLSSKIVMLIVVCVFMLIVICLLLVKKGSYGSGEITVIPSPEQSEPMQHEAFYVEEFVPVIPEGTNIANLAKVTCNAFNETYTAKKAIDGRVNGVSYWEGAKDSYPNEITLDYKEEFVTIHAIRLRLNPESVWGKRTQTLSVWMIGEDGKQEELVPSTDYVFDPKTGNEVVITFDEVKVSQIMLSFTNNTGATGAQLAEFEVYS